MGLEWFRPQLLWYSLPDTLFLSFRTIIVYALFPRTCWLTHVQVAYIYMKKEKYDKNPAIVFAKKKILIFISDPDRQNLIGSNPKIWFYQLNLPV